MDYDWFCVRNGGTHMDKNLYEAIQNQTWPQRIVTAILYPVLNLMAMYAAVLFFSVAADALSMQDRG